MKTVFPCVILFLCFSVLLVLRLPRLGKRELILVLFVRLFGLCLFRFVGFLFVLGSRKGCGLWLWHSLDFSLTVLFYLARFFNAIWNKWITFPASSPPPPPTHHPCTPSPSESPLSTPSPPPTSHTHKKNTLNFVYRYVKFMFLLSV